MKTKESISKNKIKLKQYCCLLMHLKINLRSRLEKLSKNIAVLCKVKTGKLIYLLFKIVKYINNNVHICVRLFVVAFINVCERSF